MIFWVDWDFIQISLTPRIYSRAMLHAYMYMYICTCTCFITPFNNVSARHPKSNIVSSRTGSSIYQNGGGAPSHSWPYIFFSPLLFSSDLSSKEWRNLRHHWIHYFRALTHVGVISWGLISDEMVTWKKCYIVLVYDNTILSRIICRRLYMILELIMLH